MKKLLFSYKFLFIRILIIFFFSCTSNDVGEDTDGPTKQGFPDVTTKTVIISEEGVSAEGGGEVVSAGDSEIISRGVCWSKTENPTVDDYVTKNGNGIGDFTSEIKNLEVNTRYYLRAYATNKFGTSYGGEVDFFTAKIYRGAVVLSSQEEVDIFGAENYLTIIGDVFVGKRDGSNITNLKALSSLNQIRGHLSIGDWKEGNPLLINLDGLENLVLIDTYYINDFIPKNLKISYNDNLENINALSGLSYFNGSINISSNPSLKNIDALWRVTSVNDIHFSNNSSLENIDGLMNIETIKRIFIGDNPKIENLNSLSKISGVIEDLRLIRNSSLSNISSLSKVTGVKNVVWIIECPQINNIDALNKITFIDESLGLIDTGIVNLDAFNLLTSLGKQANNSPGGVGPSGVKTFSIKENKLLTDFCGVKPLFLSEYDEVIEIKNNSYNPSREDITGDKCKKE